MGLIPQDIVAHSIQLVERISGNLHCYHSLNHFTWKQQRLYLHFITYIDVLLDVTIKQTQQERLVSYK